MTLKKVIHNVTYQAECSLTIQHRSSLFRDSRDGSGLVEEYRKKVGKIITKIV